MSQTPAEHADTTTAACPDDDCCCAGGKTSTAPASTTDVSEEERRRKVLESFGYKRRPADEEPAGEQGACGKTRRKTCC